MVYIYRLVKYNIVNPTWRENLKGCTLYKRKPLEYQTKSFILLLILIAVYDTW